MVFYCSDNLSFKWRDRVSLLLYDKFRSILNITGRSIFIDPIFSAFYLRSRVRINRQRTLAMLRCCLSFVYICWIMLHIYFLYFKIMHRTIIIYPFYNKSNLKRQSIQGILGCIKESNWLSLNQTKSTACACIWSSI